MILITHTARVTEQIGQELIELFKSSNTVEFEKLIETDSEIHHRNPDKLPLGVVSKTRIASILERKLLNAF